MRKRLRFVALLLFASVPAAFAQLDQQFWFAAPDISTQHREDDRPVRFRISTLEEPAEVRVSMPANPSFQTRILTLAANSTATVVINNPSQYENTPPNQVLNKGFLITSTALVSAFYEVGELWNVDIFALKGQNALGQEFILPNQTIWNVGGPYTDAHSSVTLVATEDNTVVTFIPSRSVIGHGSQDTVTLILDRGETYSNYARRTGPVSLNGSIITANKPIAVTISDDSIVLNGCRDLAGDQLVPIGVLGEEHIVAKGALEADERLFITATEDGTKVYINGNQAPLDTLGRGQTLSYRVDDLTYVRTSAPAYVMHYTGVGCEVGAALIPSINCKGSNQVGFTRSSEEEFYMTVLVRQGGEQSFTLNGDASLLPPSSFVPVPGTNNEWLISSRAYSLSDMPAGRSYLLRNEQFSFQLGILDGGPGTGTRYGYFSNFASLFIGDDFTLCTGAERVIVPKGEPGASYLWSDGSTDPTLTVRTAGDYWVSMTNASGCVLTDTLSVDVNPESFLALDTLVGGCNGETVMVDPGVHASYQWSNGTRRRRLSTRSAGIYSVEVINANGCIDQDSVEVVFQEKHAVDLGPDVLVCPDVPDLAPLPSVCRLPQTIDRL
ncbi:MAG: IgGFc-binding protein [Bacteroidota bacterium]